MGESLWHVEFGTTPAALLIARPVDRMLWGMGPHVSTLWLTPPCARGCVAAQCVAEDAGAILLFDREPSLGESGQLLISVGDPGQRFLGNRIDRLLGRAPSLLSAPSPVRRLVLAGLRP